MVPKNSIPVLNRLVEVLTRSLPQYLVFAKPYHFGKENELALETFEQIADDESALCERIEFAISESNGIVNIPGFPTEFTSLHDLGMDFIVHKAIIFQREDIEFIAGCVNALRMAPAAKSYAEEALGLFKGHLETLMELESNLSPSMS